MKLVFASDGRGGEVLGGFTQGSLFGGGGVSKSRINFSRNDRNGTRSCVSFLNLMGIPHGVNLRGDSF